MMLLANMCNAHVYVQQYCSYRENNYFKVSWQLYDHTIHVLSELTQRIETGWGRYDVTRTWTNSCNAYKGIPWHHQVNTL